MKLAKYVFGLGNPDVIKGIESPTKQMVELAKTEKKRRKEEEEKVKSDERIKSVFEDMDKKFPRKPYKEVSASLSPQQMQQQNVNNAQQNPQQVQQHQPPSNNGKPTVVVLPPEEETYNQIKHTVAPELPNPALHMGSVYGECPHDGISEKSIGTLIGTNPKTEVHKFPYGTKDTDGYWWVL